MHLPSFRQLFHLFPGKLQSHLSRINFIVRGKPRCIDSGNLPKRFPGHFRGGVIFSADLELGWAVRYSKQQKDPVEYAQRERANVPVILRLFDQYSIPVTWAVVGHLFLEGCSRGDHDRMARIPFFTDPWNYNQGDWFDCDPYSNWQQDPAWYAPDLIRQILDSPKSHEIACHTFTHIDSSDKNCPPEVMADEMAACLKAASKWGITLKSMTFPGGGAGNFEVLIRHGIEICKVRHPDYVLAYPHFNEHGMLITYTGPAITFGYPDWSAEYTVSRFRKAVDKAIKKGSLVHFWFHPSQHKSDFEKLLPGLLAYCAQKRDEGLLWTGTMGDISKFIKSLTGTPKKPIVE